MTIAGDAFRKLPIESEMIISGPTKFQLMLAVFDGEHTDIRPRLFTLETLRENGSGKDPYHHSFQAHIYGAVWDSGYWILEGVDGHWGMSGLVKHHSFIAQYDTEKKKGHIKFLDFLD